MMSILAAINVPLPLAAADLSSGTEASLGPVLYASLSLLWEVLVKAVLVISWI